MTTTEGPARHRVGAVDEFDEGVFRIVDIEGRSVGVVRTNRGFFAVLNVCPHQHAPICEGRLGGTMRPSAPGEYVYSDDESVLSCPWHRWEFDVATGESYGRVTRKRLLTFDVEIVGTDVFVRGRRGRAAE